MQRNFEPPKSLRTTYVNANLDIWIQLGEESRQANEMLLETMQQLCGEMTNLRIDNERLHFEHERILRSLSN